MPSVHNIKFKKFKSLSTHLIEVNVPSPWDEKIQVFHMFFFRGFKKQTLAWTEVSDLLEQETDKIFRKSENLEITTIFRKIEVQMLLR